MQVEGERVLEGLARVIAEELGLFANVGLAAQERLLVETLKPVVSG